MQPNQSLDQDAVNLAKAIRQTESGGNFTAKGKSGEYGAYQFTRPTWETQSKKFGINVPLEKATPAQQNEVAYKQIKEWKDQGHNVGAIASLWNSGKPDAYLDTSYKGTNKYGAKYDVPAYAKSVATAYQTLKKGGQVGVDPNNPSSTAAPQTLKEESDFLTKAGGIINSIFPGEQIGKAIGTGLGYLTTPKEQRKYYDTSTPTPLQIAGDIGQAALTVAPGLGGAAESALGRIGQGALLGGGIGLTGALAKGSTDVGDIAQQSGAGALTGGALSTVGELVSKAAQYLPERISRSFIPGINEETNKYAVEKGLSSPKNMLSESQDSIKNLGSELGNVLKNYADHTVDGAGLLQSAADQFPDSGLTADEIAKNIKKLVPLKANLVDKLSDGTITFQELHSLNSSLGPNVFKTVFDDPTVKAGKDVGNAIYHTISDYIKGVAPETGTLFEQLSKEYPLKKALEQVIRRGNKSRLLTLRDLVAFSTGSFFGGPAGGLTGALAEKAMVNPTVNLKTAGLLSRLAPVAQSSAMNPVSGLLTRSVSKSAGR